jgi:2,3-bisphosphoglycerate-independent phosphoglycerate mutase
MVGHSGVFDAAVKAVEAVDYCLGRLVEAITKTGGVMLMTADHGNVEMMRDAKGNPHTQHTINPVPFVVVGASQGHIREGGTLADIAPTVLALMGIAQPAEMTGQSLVVFAKEQALHVG